MADFDGTLSDFGTLPALNSAYLEKDIYFLLPRTDYARRYQVGVWGGTFRSDLEKKGVCAGLCRERCLHDGVLFADRYGPCARKREKFAVKRPGEPLFLRMSEGMSLPRRRQMPGQARHDEKVRPGMTRRSSPA